MQFFFAVECLRGLKTVPASWLNGYCSIILKYCTCIIYNFHILHII